MKLHQCLTPIFFAAAAVALVAHPELGPRGGAKVDTRSVLSSEPLKVGQSISIQGAPSKPLVVKNLFISGSTVDLPPMSLPIDNKINGKAEAIWRGVEYGAASRAGRREKETTIALPDSKRSVTVKTQALGDPGLLPAQWHDLLASAYRALWTPTGSKGSEASFEIGEAASLIDAVKIKLTIN